MTHEHILKCAKAIFGEDIIIDAQAEDLHLYNKTTDLIDEDLIDLGDMAIFVTFVNGRTIRISSNDVSRHYPFT